MLSKTIDQDLEHEINLENEKAQKRLAALKPLQRIIFEEIKGRMNYNSTPIIVAPYEYYLRLTKSQQYPDYYRKPVRYRGSGKMVIDINALAKGERHFHIATLQVSPNNKWLAFTYDVNGNGYYKLNLTRMKPGDEGLPLRQLARVPGSRWARLDGNRSGARDTVSFVWDSEGEFLFYTVLDKWHRPHEVYRHRVGSEPNDDSLVFRELDPNFFLSLGKTEDDVFITITVHNYATSEVHVIPSNRPTELPLVVWPRLAGRKYSVSHHRGSFIILTNAEGCLDFKIVRVPAYECSFGNCETIVPHRGGRIIEKLQVYKHFLVWQERRNCRTRIVAKRLRDNKEISISSSKTIGDVNLLQGRFNTWRFTYEESAFATAPTIFRYNVGTGSKESIVCETGGQDERNGRYRVNRFYTKADDGESIPVSIIRPVESATNRPIGTLLYAYGSYGRSMKCSFYANNTACHPFWDRLSLVDRGITYATAHVRGGGDKGASWHRQGKGMNKNNMVLDYLAVARDLVNRGYASEGGIVAHGDSAGGLLVTAAVNREPSLFCAVIAEVPVLDLISSLTDLDFPLARLEWEEWGNPLKDEEAMKMVIKCCPQETLPNGYYPHVFVTAGLSDWMVPVSVPAGWIRKLHSRSRGGNDIIFKVNMSSGHAGPSGRLDKLAEVSEIYAYVIHVCKSMN